jgi:Protein of unknown function (DUF3485)
MFRMIPALVAVALIIGSGIVHALWTDRWSLSNEPKASAERLDQVPQVLGDWQGTDGPPVDAQDMAIGEIAGFLSRSYVNRQTGASVGLLMVCGRPGSISVHTPDVCFVGGGQELLRKDHRQLNLLPGGPPQDFLVGYFRKRELEGTSHSRAFWAWSADGNWSAPNHPRFTFAGKKALYKLYVVHQIQREEETIDEDPSLEFMGVLLPELKKVLFTPEP